MADNVFGIPTLEGIVGCLSPEGYRYARNRSLERQPVLRGRPIYRLRDPDASYIVSVTMDLSDNQFATWQGFWNGAAQRGKRRFIMRLSLDSVETFTVGGEAYIVNAVGPWNASVSDITGRWKVTLNVEVPAVIGFQITICDVVYGGPVDDPADDVIWNGPIDNLPTDVIEPCEGVLDLG